MGTIYLVRHGQAQANAYGIDTAAASDGPIGSLTEAGAAQAALTGKLLADQIPNFTGAISGDLPRQTQTLAGVLGAFDAAPTPQVDPGWNEYELSSLMGTATAEEYLDGRSFQQHLDIALSRWVDGATPTTGGESYTDFAQRVAASAKAAIAQAGSGETLLVVSSAGVITQWIAQLFSIPGQSWPALSRAMVNASVSKLIVGRTGVNLVSFNEHLHLSDRDGGIATFR
ncbi:phosphoglycerate mutase family protein [Gordonia effusa NBRC 100432]|uniref:Phosphoglycerate mutase family protein n=1 Tax=Gordonia effusa NBRC 100432 TaxID=1077974 RepID=H0QVW8_9ACTN|nr:histidine phosphatase family protein [Gordonia effusa]GAB16969.1 phosphoglycerate mutase family protein [Gordonia effusa NBRC 100432]